MGVARWMAVEVTFGNHPSSQHRSMAVELSYWPVKKRLDIITSFYSKLFLFSPQVKYLDSHAIMLGSYESNRSNQFYRLQTS